MWLVEHEKWDDEGNETCYIKDVVDTYENLTNYFAVLFEKNPHLKLKETIPRGTNLRDTILILEGEYEVYSIIRMLPTNVPT